MNKLLLLSLLYSISFSENNNSRYQLEKIDKTEIDKEVTLEKKSLMILPFIEKKHGALADKILTVLSNQAMSLGRFEIIDRNNVNEILEEQKFQLSGIVNNELVVEVGKLASAEEALILEITHFGQKGVPKKEEGSPTDDDDDDDTVFKWLVKTTVKETIKNIKSKDTLAWENNIHTEFRGSIKIVNIQTGILEHSFNLSSHYTGGNRDISLTNILEQISFQIRRQLKNIYMITSEIIEIDNNEINIISGEDLGIQKGAMFEVSSNSRIKKYKGNTINLPGKTRGIIKITDVGINGSSGKIVRKWGKIKIGQKAFELKSPPVAKEFNLTYSYSKRYELAGKIWINYLSDFTGSINAHIGTINDSRNNMDGYLGVGTDISYNLFSGFGTRGNLSINIPASLAWTTDDDGHNVASFFSDPSIDGNLAIQISKTKDIVFNISYVFTKLHGPWQWQRDTGSNDDDGNNITETERAIWLDGLKPAIEPEGFYFSVSIRTIRF